MKSLLINPDNRISPIVNNIRYEGPLKLTDSYTRMLEDLLNTIPSQTLELSLYKSQQVLIPHFMSPIPVATSFQKLSIVLTTPAKQPTSTMEISNITDKSIREFLVVNPVIEAELPKIIDKAKQILGMYYHSCELKVLTDYEEEYYNKENGIDTLAIIFYVNIKDLDEMHRLWRELSKEVYMMVSDEIKMYIAVIVRRAYRHAIPTM